MVYIPVFYSRCKTIICAPKGRKETLANLKYCIPKGIPTMVMHHKIPSRQDTMPSSQPKTTIQIMFSKKLPAPLEKAMSLPNGQMIKEANLKHCIPTGTDGLKKINHGVYWNVCIDIGYLRKPRIQ